jgi:multiple sugar transport system permease protein
MRADQKTAYILIAPVMVTLILLIGYPFLISIGISLTDKHVGTEGRFVGLHNFLELVRNPAFQRVLENSLIYTVVAVFFKVILGLPLALIMAQMIKGGRFLRALFLLPWVIPTSISALAWWWIFNPLFGVSNWILKETVAITVPWLSEPFWARFAIITVNIWRGLPFFAISFLAGLVSIPQELYEAAEIDGANKVSKFFYVTLPLLKPVLGIIVLYSVIMTISDFEIVWVITKGGPRMTTHLFGTFAFQIGLLGSRIGEGAAISLFLFPVMLIASFLWLRILRRGIEFG